MFLGYIGVALILKTLCRNVNLAWFIAAALLPELILSFLVLAGVEFIYAPGNYYEVFYYNYDFPYSHSVLASLITAGLLFLLLNKRFNTSASLFIILAYLSHIALDLVGQLDIT